MFIFQGSPVFLSLAAIGIVLEILISNLKPSRSSVLYDQPNAASLLTSSSYPACKPAAAKRHVYDLAIMNRIDEIYTSRPYYGYRRIHVKLIEAGFRINIKKTRRLMRDMGLYAIYPKRNLSKMYLRQYIHPYLLRNLKIERPNHVWGCDLTYIRLGQGKGFMYLFAIIDLYSRLIIDYELCKYRFYRASVAEIIGPSKWLKLSHSLATI